MDWQCAIILHTFGWRSLTSRSCIKALNSTCVSTFGYVSKKQLSDDSKLVISRIFSPFLCLVAYLTLFKTWIFEIPEGDTVVCKCIIKKGLSFFWRKEFAVKSRGRGVHLVSMKFPFLFNTMDLKLINFVTLVRKKKLIFFHFYFLLLFFSSIFTK